MTLSVITLTFNNYDELKATYESIFKVDNVDYEWVVINGGDCPKTKLFLENLSDNNFKYISEKDNGIYDAFNKGVALASGELLVFINSGDLLISETYLRDVVLKFKSSIETSFCYSNIIFVDENAGKLVFKYDKNKHISEGMPYFHQTLVVRKDIFNQIGLFDTYFKIAGDYDWVMRMTLSGFQGYYFDEESILMDGKGISAKQEFKSIKECFYSLKINKNLGLRSCLGVFYRFLKFCIRKVFYKVGGGKILRLLKSIKYESSN